GVGASRWEPASGSCTPGSISPILDDESPARSASAPRGVSAHPMARREPPHPCFLQAVTAPCSPAAPLPSAVPAYAAPHGVAAEGLRGGGREAGRATGGARAVVGEGTSEPGRRAHRRGAGRRATGPARRRARTLRARPSVADAGDRLARLVAHALGGPYLSSR